MTKQELINMVGNEDQASYALDLVLKNLKPAFIKSIVDLELKEINKEIQAMKDAGFIVTCNGHDSVNWGAAEQLNGWNLSEEQQLKYDEAWAKCTACNDLLYRRNRTTSLVAFK